MLSTEDKELIDYAREVIDKNYDAINWWHTVGAAVRTKSYGRKRTLFYI